MININNKQQCCGCGACVQRCPKHSISLLGDNEGFQYPHVDTETCIECGLCEKVCPIQNPYEKRKPLQVLAAINKDEKIRMESSSGGVFTLLAEQIIREGGVVFGARFDEEWQVTLDYTETTEGLASFRGSKYVQARTAETYKQCEQFLKEGRKVLFTGSPCQIAGLHHYLQKEYTNLITCDFSCHGVPSPEVWRKYLNAVIMAFQRTATDVIFRNNDNGWKRFNVKIESTQGGKVVFLTSFYKKNQYMNAFLNDIIMRPSCYNCSAKEGRSMSDITIADYWGVDMIHSEIDDDKGISLVLANSDKGKSILSSLDYFYIETDASFAIRQNKGLYQKQINIPKKRDFFFNQILVQSDIIALMEECTPKKNISQIHKVKHKIVNYIKTLIGWQNLSSFGEYKIVQIKFRDKSDSWRKYQIQIKLYNART